MVQITQQERSLARGTGGLKLKLFLAVLAKNHITCSWGVGVGEVVTAKFTRLSLGKFTKAG